MKCPKDSTHTVKKNTIEGKTYDHCVECCEDVAVLNEKEELFHPGGMIDPPSGWKYGFPRKIPISVNIHSDQEFKQWLLDCGYPEKDLDLALRHSRWIGG